jgi:hypothetical protein
MLTAGGLAARQVATGRPATPADPLVHPPGMRVLVPAYFYPVPGSPWSRLNAAAATHPGRIYAIGNPASGPGTSIDPTYTSTFNAFRASGGELLGYVYTSYAARPLDEVKADVDAWVAFYGIDGFFVDEMSNVPGQAEDYYLALNQHMQASLPGALSVGNPGTSTQPGYLFQSGERVVDALCIHENSTDFLTWHADPWVMGYGKHNFYALPHTVSPGLWQPYVDHAHAENCGWFYCTDDTLPNPWDTLPPFFEALVAYVDAAY